MATKNAGNLIAELERRYLECNICTELFDEDKRIPRLLPCHHPFCSECLKRLGHRKDSIKCPTCNAVHKVKKNGPSDFPKDNTRRDLTSFLQVHSDLNSFKKCCLCGNTVDVTYKCQQCNINLCESCRCQHEKENKTHKSVVNKSEIFQEDDLDVCQNPNHERAKLKHFCNSSNCQCVLCPSCVIAEHRDINKHELEDIEEAFQKRKKELGDDVKSLRTKISHVKATVQNVLDNTNTLQDEKNEFLQNVDEIYNRGIQVLENRKQNLVERYSTVFKRKVSNENSRKPNLESFLQNASECCTLSEQLISHDSKSSFLNVHQTIDAHVKRYLKTPIEDPTTYDENDVEKNINDTLQMFKRNVEVLENTGTRREENLESLIEPANGNIQQYRGTTVVNIFGNFIYNNTAIAFSQFIQKVKQTILYVIALMSMIMNASKMLKQRLRIISVNPNDIQTYQEQPNERHVRQVPQRRRHFRRHNIRPIETADVPGPLGLEMQTRKQIQEYIVIFWAVLWNIALLVCMLVFICELRMLPLIFIEHNSLTGLKFNTEVTSQFPCRSADNQTVATKPSENLLCGSTRRLFKYKGVFANTSFLPEKESSIDFSVKVQLMSLQLNENRDIPIFEFGLTNNSISTTFLFPSIFSVSAFTCQNKLGVCLSFGDTNLIETKDIFTSGTNSHFSEARFILNYQFSNFTLFFLSAHKTIKRTSDLHRVQHLKLRSPVWPVFAIYTNTAVSMIIKTKQVGFDRFTLHPNLHISDDDKKISNKRLSGTFPSDSFGFPVIYTRPKQFLTSSYIQTKINIDFAESNKGEILFKIGTGKQKDGAFKATPLLVCTKCAMTYVYGFYHTNGYCLSSTNDSTWIAVGNQFSLFLHYNRNGIIEVYIVGYYFGYSYHSFQLEPFHNVHPRIYIEKYSAKDIKISTSKNADLLNLKSLLFGLLSIVLLPFV